MLDISTAIEVSETFDIAVIHPVSGEQMADDKGKPLSVTAYGPGTKVFAKAKAAQNKRFLERLRRKGKADPGEDEIAADTAMFLSACTKSFNNFSYEGGNDEKAFRACYADPKMGWLRDLVNADMGDWANFMKDSSPSS